MTLDSADLRALTSTLADRLYIQVAGWHLYLGDAGLAEALAIECSALLDQGAVVAARQALEAVQVPNWGRKCAITDGASVAVLSTFGPRGDSRRTLPIRLKRCWTLPC